MANILNCIFFIKIYGIHWKNINLNDNDNNKGCIYDKWYLLSVKPSLFVFAPVKESLNSSEEVFQLFCCPIEGNCLTHPTLITTQIWFNPKTTGS